MTPDPGPTVTDETEARPLHPTEPISAVVARVNSNGPCPHWCRDTRRGPHWHDYTRALADAGYALTIRDRGDAR